MIRGVNHADGPTLDGKNELVAQRTCSHAVEKRRLRNEGRDDRATKEGVNAQ